MELWRQSILIVCAFAAVACRDIPKGGEPAAVPAATPLKYGVMPAVTAAETTEIYRPLMDKIAAAIHRPVELVIAPSYDALEAQVLGDGLDLAQVSSFLYVTASIKRIQAGRPLTLIAQEVSTPERGYRGVFLVKPDSVVKTLADLKGKKMAYVAKTSSAGYYFQRMRLRELGLDPDKLFGGVEFAGSHDAVVDRVKAGGADVGAVSEIRGTLSGLKVVDKTAEIPGDTIVALSSQGVSKAAELTRFFTTADKDASLVNMFIARGLAKYVVGSDESYAPERQELSAK